jgi:hypothetical protein
MADRDVDGMGRDLGCQNDRFSGRGPRVFGIGSHRNIEKNRIEYRQLKFIEFPQRRDQRGRKREVAGKMRRGSVVAVVNIVLYWAFVSQVCLAMPLTTVEFTGTSPACIRSDIQAGSLCTVQQLVYFFFPFFPPGDVPTYRSYLGCGECERADVCVTGLRYGTFPLSSLSAVGCWLFGCAQGRECRPMYRDGTSVRTCRDVGSCYTTAAVPQYSSVPRSLHVCLYVPR